MDRTLSTIRKDLGTPLTHLVKDILDYASSKWTKSQSERYGRVLVFETLSWTSAVKKLIDNPDQFLKEV